MMAGKGLVWYGGLEDNWGVSDLVAPQKSTGRFSLTPFFSYPDSYFSGDFTISPWWRLC